MDDIKNSSSGKTDLQLTPGTKLNNDKYVIKKVLGQGGYGITYLATDNSGNQLAIKEFFPATHCIRIKGTNTVLPSTQSNNELMIKFRSKFLKEAKLLTELNSPDIVRVFDVFQQNGTAYYAMNYIAGKSLLQIVKEHGPLSTEQAIMYIVKVGNALTYIHSRNMTHLDVKPANIMVRSVDDSPILIDFGLSKRYDEQGGETSNTPTGRSQGFAPLEQYANNGVKTFSPRTDLYSLAATLYYLLTGIIPPEATRLLEEALTFPASFPPALIAPVRQAMSIRRNDRQDSVATFIREIKDSGAASSGQGDVEIPIVEVCTEQTQMPNQPPQSKIPKPGYNVKPQSKHPGQSSVVAGNTRPTKSKSKKVLKWVLLSVLAIIVVAIAGYALGLYIKANEEDSGGGLIPSNETINVPYNPEEVLGLNNDRPTILRCVL